MNHREQVTAREAFKNFTDTVAILSKAANGGFTGGGMSVTDAREKGQREADDMSAAPAPPSDPREQQAWAETLSPEQLGRVSHS